MCLKEAPSVLLRQSEASIPGSQGVGIDIPLAESVVLLSLPWYKDSICPDGDHRINGCRNGKDEAVMCFFDVLPASL